MADQNIPSTSEPMITNIVLVGRTGNGKSSTANSLIGKKSFLAKRRAGGVTTKCEMVRAATPDGPIINVIDTPGLFDVDVSADFLTKETIKCLEMAKEGIHAMLFVLSAKNQITQEEESTLNALQRIFEAKILDYFIVVFTAGDELEEEGVTLDEYLGIDCPIFLTNVLRLCGGRKVLFDNKTKDETKKAAQLKQLLAHVADVTRQTSGIPYTDKLHRKIQEENEKLREKEKEILSKNLAEAEAASMREKSGMEYEQTMKMVQQMMEQTLKQSTEAHAREMNQMREMFQQQQQGFQQTGGIQNIPSASEPITNIVLVGRGGNGKSATGNSILGHKMFDSNNQSGRFNMRCDMYRCAIEDGPILNVIDTPSLFDLAVSTDFLGKEIIKCLDMAEEGIHVVLFVLSVRKRISHEEELSLNALQRILGCKILDYSIVVFTGGDKLEEKGLTLDDFLGQNCPLFLKTVLRLCGGRKILFDNKTEDKDKKAAQLKQLLAYVADVRRKTGGKPYTGKPHSKDEYLFPLPKPGPVECNIM